MGINAHDNPELGDVPARAPAVAAPGCSNCNCHGGGSTFPEGPLPQEVRDTIVQFNSMVPRLQTAVEQLERGR